MADNQPRRVSKPRGSYNEYLRKENPFQHIPRSSKRRLLSKDKRFSELTENDRLQMETMRDTSLITEGEESCGSTSIIAPKKSQLLEDIPDEVITFKEGSYLPNHSDREIHVVVNTSGNTDVLDTGTDFEMQQQEYEMLHINKLPKENEETERNEIYMAAASTDDTILKSNEDIYKGASLSLGASMLLIITFALKHSLSGEGFNDLLKLIEMHCPPSNCVPKNLGKLKKHLEDVKHPLIFHKFCSHCNMLLEGVNIQDGVCPNQDCKNILGIGNAISHFIEIPIKEQIKSFFSRAEFLEDINYRFTRVKRNPNAYEDIYDGEVYKNLSSNNGFLSNPHNLSLLWNTDGIPCFKSSKMSLWPLFFEVNELPYWKRILTENMILGGLWFGVSKPAVMSFTRPFIDCLQDLEENGIVIEHGKIGTFKCRVAVIGGTADLPARSLACNTVQFNGKYGCCKCLQPGETFKIGTRGHCHIFPFQHENPFGPLRTMEGFARDVETAVLTGVNTHGVKGPSFMQCLKHYDLARGTCIDYMHGILLGVTKLLLKLWFSSDYTSEMFSISSCVDIVDKRLCSIKPPNNISRCPRSIKEHLNYWKATELKSWLLYYSLPILKDIHTSDIYQHYILFVEAVFLLLQDSVSVLDVEKAESLFLHFCCMFAAYYGARYMTCNVHQLLHLPQMVRSMGPLWVYSCFPYENANGNLLKLYHGTQKVDMQIAESVCMMQKIPKLYFVHIKPDTPEMELYQSINGTYLHKNEVHLINNIYAIGSGTSRKLQEFQMHKVMEYLGFRPTTYLSFKRIRIGREIFHSRIYLRCVSRNSYTVVFKTSCEGQHIGQIEFFLQIQSDDRQYNVALVSPMEIENSVDCRISKDLLTAASVGHIHVLKPVEQYKVFVIPVDCIVQKCVFMEFPDKKGVVYACTMVNKCEQE